MTQKPQKDPYLEFRKTVVLREAFLVIDNYETNRIPQYDVKTEVAASFFKKRVFRDIDSYIIDVFEGAFEDLRRAGCRRES